MNCDKHIYQEINGVVNICQVCWKEYDLATQLNSEVYCVAKIYILLVFVKSPKSFFSFMLWLQQYAFVWFRCKMPLHLEMSLHILISRNQDIVVWYLYIDTYPWILIICALILWNHFVVLRYILYTTTLMLTWQICLRCL